MEVEAMFLCAQVENELLRGAPRYYLVNEFNLLR